MSRTWRLFTALALSAATVGLNAPANAAKTWVGNTDTDLNNALNWGAVQAVPGIETVTFGAAGSSGSALTVSGSLINNGWTFTAAAPAYTFSDAGSSTSFLYWNRSASQSTTNNSPLTQTFNVTTMVIDRGTVNAAAGDFVFNVPVAIEANGSGAKQVTFTGSHDIYLNNGILNDQSQSVIKAGAGTLYLGESPAGFEDAGRWKGNVFINSGNLEISHDYSLGENGSGDTVTGITEVRSAFQSPFVSGGTNDTARITLTGSINSAETVFLAGRTSNTSAHIFSKSGVNTLSGTLIPEVDATNNVVSLQSDGLNVGDKLVVTAQLPQINSDTTAMLSLQGDGNGEFAGQLAQPASTTIFGLGALQNNVWGLIKDGAGTWTVTSAQTYTGTTTINHGTLAIGAAGSIASSPSINVKSGAILDVSAQPGGFTLGAAQALGGAGTVLGNVADLAGSGNVIAPGDSGVGTLNLNGNLSLQGGSTLQFDLTNLPSGTNDLISAVGNLNLSGLTNITVNPISGSLANGTYRLIDYTGSLTGNASNLSIAGGGARQTFNLSTSVAHQVNLTVAGNAASLTWVGGLNSNAWDVNTTVNWTGAADNHFFNSDSVSFTSTGSNSPSINIVGSVAPNDVAFSNGAGHDYTFSGGDLLASGNLSATGAGNVSFTNGNFAAASISASGAGISLSNSGTTTIAGNVNASNSANLQLLGAGAIAVSGGISTSGAASLSIGSGVGATVGSLSAGSSAQTTVSGAAFTVAGNFTTSGSGNVDFNNGNLTISGAFSQNSVGVTTIANSGTVNLPTAISLNAGTLAFNRGDSIVIASSISGAGTLRKDGAGTMSFTPAANNSLLTGPVIVAGGTLRVSNGTGTTLASTNPNALGTGDAGTTVMSGATLDLNGSQFPNEIVTIAGFGPTGFDGALADNRGNNKQRGLVKGIILSADASMHVAEGGAPLVTGDGSIFDGQGHDFTLFGGGELTLTTADDINVGNLTIDASPFYFFGTPFSNNAGVITLQNNGKIGMVNSPTLTKELVVGVGNGEVVSYYSDNTIASQVTLNSDLQTSVYTGLSEPGTVTLTVSGKVTGSAGLSAHANPNVDDSYGIVALTSDSNDYAGITTIGGGSSGYTNVTAEKDRITLSIGNGGATGRLGTGDVVDNATLQFNRTGTLAVANNISGTGNVTAVAAGGAITLTGANSYAGTTTVSAGSLIVNGSHTGGGDYSVAATASLGGTGMITSNVIVDAGGILAPGDGIGAFTLGSATINGTLKVEYNVNSIDLLSASGTLDISNATIDFDKLGLDNLASGNYVFATYGDLTGAAFASVTDLPAGYAINYHYAGNQIALVTALPGDLNADGIVDGADFGVWQTGFPTTSGGGLASGDADGDGDVDGADFIVWQTHYPTPASTNAVPEPQSWLLGLLAFVSLGRIRSKMRK